MSDIMRADLEQIRHHAQMIVSHPSDDDWTGKGCEVSMLHDGEDILRIIDRVLRRYELSTRTR